MNEMYDMSIVTHNYGVLGILIVVLLNLFLLYRAKEISKYKRIMSIFTPMGSMAIGGVIFTGVIMMAAKHLEFTLANVVMIFFALAFILLEVKRAKTLKYSSVQDATALERFKPLGMKILVTEIVMTLAISLWMWA